MTTSSDVPSFFGATYSSSALATDRRIPGFLEMAKKAAEVYGESHVKKDLWRLAKGGNGNHGPLVEELVRIFTETGSVFIFSFQALASNLCGMTMEGQYINGVRQGWTAKDPTAIKAYARKRLMDWVGSKEGSYEKVVPYLRIIDGTFQLGQTRRERYSKETVGYAMPEILPNGVEKLLTVSAAEAEIAALLAAYNGKSEQAQPVEAQPVEAQPVEAQPVEAQPVEAQPVEAQPVEAQPVEAQPVEAQPVEAQPVEAPTRPSRPRTQRKPAA